MQGPALTTSASRPSGQRFTGYTLGAYVLCALLASGAAQADTQLEYHSEPAQRGQMQRLSIKQGQLRVDLGAAHWMLYRQQDAALVIVDDQARTYTIMDQATLGQVNAALQAARAEMEAALAQMPPTQREQMRQMMESAMGQLSQGDQGLSFDLRDTGQRLEINGIACRQLEATRGQRRIAQLCLADAEQLGVSRADAQVFTAWAEFTQGMMESLASQAQGIVPFQAPSFGAFAQGLPVQNIDEDGSRTELQGHNNAQLDEALFQIPSDYQRQTLDIGS